MDLSECGDDDENEEKCLSSKEAGRSRKIGIDSHSIWKTSLCSYFRRPTGGVCRHGEDCRYAHGEAELRPRHDNSWDPTSERAKKLLKTNNGYASSGVPGDDEDDTVDLIALDKCLIGLPKKWASENLKSFLGSQEIRYITAKKKKGMTVGFVSFENAEQVKNAIEVLRENPLNCKQVKVADAICGQQKKIQMMKIAVCTSSTEDGSILAHGDDDVSFDTPNTEGIATKNKAVCDVVTPLGRMPYKDQVDHKRNSLFQTLKRLTRNARKACPACVSLPEWVLKSREIGGLPCKFEGVLESPLIDGYRNKCEFSVGCSLEGKQTVGFMLGNFRNGVTAVEEPHNCPNISRISCKYAKLFQNFIQSSELPVWNRIYNTGFWRQFTVREGRCSSEVSLYGSVGTDIAEVMLIVQVCSLDYEEEQIKREFNKMTQALAQGAATCSPPLPLTTIVVQDHKGISNVAPANCPLITLQLPMVDDICGSGVICTTEGRIHDRICNLRFSISPTAFFQVNTLAAERLYSLAGDWADLTPDTILFDICCGTGTIGLTLAHRVGMVVGIEVNEAAVSDANRNAEINGIKNCRFICGKAEDVMGSMLEEYLDAPQHHVIVSDDKGCSNVPNVGNDTNNMIYKEDLQDDTDASSGVSAADPIPEILPCVEDNLNEELSDPKSNTDGGLEQLPIVTDNSSGITGNCSAECIGTEFNQGSRDTEENKVADTAVHQFKRVVVIVDPPRVGLHPIVIKALRTHPRICRLVYISCNPETLVANAIELCTPTADKPEKGKGNRRWRKMSNAGLARNRVKSMPCSEAFQPIKATGVDLFPHTPHCEMVMLLERVSLLLILLSVYNKISIMQSSIFLR